jgi:hypothetical protein
MTARNRGWLAALALLLAASGCGSSSGLVPASGKLTYHGEPVPSTQVTFQPDDGSRPSHGVTDDAGRFTLRYSRTEDGVSRGRHTVYLKYQPSPAEQEHEAPPKASKELREVIARYGDRTTSPLHYEVTKSGQFFDIELE